MFKYCDKHSFHFILVLQCFDAVGLAAGGHPACKTLSGEVLAWLSADFHMAQLMPLPLTISCSSKPRLFLPSWFYFSGTGLPG